MKPAYGRKVELCYMDTNSFVYEVETEEFYRGTANDVEERFDTSGYLQECSRPLPVGKNKKVIGLMKEELAGKIMTEFVALRAKMYAYRKLDEREPEAKRCKGTMKCAVAETINFDDYKKCLFVDETMHGADGRETEQNTEEKNTSDKVIDKLYEKFVNPPSVKIDKREALEMGKPACPINIEMYADGLKTIMEQMPYEKERYTINTEKLKANISANKLFCDNLAMKISSK